MLLETFATKASQKQGALKDTVGQSTLHLAALVIPGSSSNAGRSVRAACYRDILLHNARTAPPVLLA